MALDPSTQARIAQLHPAFQPVAVAMLSYVNTAYASQGVSAGISQAYRSVAEQNNLYAQGRTRPGAIVTNVRGGWSLHQFRLAFDMLLRRNGVVTWDNRLYKAVGKDLARRFPITVWGGNFPQIFGGSFTDYPHFQFHPGYDPGTVTARLQRYLSFPTAIPFPMPTPTPEFVQIPTAEWKKMCDLMFVSMHEIRKEDISIVNALSENVKEMSEARAKLLSLATPYRI